ncbi:hypothetical protein ACFM35_09605 [Microbacterium sp. P01]|uniref:hypothetical protein n=1 Tax=Microbacterium sp. P01 TaxID=3366261 RepID=UPI00366CB740
MRLFTPSRHSDSGAVGEPADADTAAEAGTQTDQTVTDAAPEAAASVTSSTAVTGGAVAQPDEGSGRGVERAAIPARPPLRSTDAPPVLVKLPPPFFVRVSQLFWIVSLLLGAAAIVYMFVIRQAQLPDIAELVRTVDGTRAEQTYTAAADIVFWSIFAPTVAIVLLQIVFQVSFSNRRPNVRWWQFGSLLAQVGVFLIARELVAFGERGMPLEQIMLLQIGAATAGLLVSVLPQALRWTARKHDVRRGPIAPAADTQL